MTDNALVPHVSWLPAQKLPAVEQGESPLLYLNRIMQMLPPPSEDVVQKLTAAILMADGPVAENEIWESSAGKAVIGKRYTFHSVHMSPSDYQESPLDFFLVCHVTDHDTGEKGILTTGATNVVAALVKAQILGALPWDAEICGPRRPLRSGHVPLHIRWIAKVVESDDE